MIVKHEAVCEHNTAPNQQASYKVMQEVCMLTCEI